MSKITRQDIDEIVEVCRAQASEHSERPIYLLEFPDMELVEIPADEMLRLHPRMSHFVLTPKEAEPDGNAAN
jgi:hypothetical protein